MVTVLVLVVGALALHGRTASAQYYDAQVLQKSFEKTDFFFRPGYLNPYGSGAFGRSAAGFVRDPLVELQLSPSRFGADDSTNDYVYIDFRSTSRTSSYDSVWPMYRDGAVSAEPGGNYAVADRIAYPIYYREARRLSEPVIAAALFLRPVPGSLPGLTVGLTYQAIVDDQGYYSIPQDVYRSAPGMDYSGGRMTNESYDITDVYTGSDDMHQVGHFPTLYAGYGNGGPWRFGLRAEFASFDRTGESGTTSRTPASVGQLASIWSHVEQRDQQYDHLDLVAGAEYRANAMTLAGLSIGYLDGNATQSLIRRDTSFWGQGTGTRPVNGSWTRNMQGGATDASWAEDGSTLHGTAFLRRFLGDGRILTATWAVRRESVDLAVASSVRDTSEYLYFYNEGANRWESEGWGRVTDERAGGGTRTGTGHRISLAMEWPMATNTRLTVGGNLDIDRSRTETGEDVEAYRSRYYRNFYDGRQDLYDERITEEKVLEWRFDSRRTSIRIPILVAHRFSKSVEIMAGITREMSSWRIEDETLALFDLRRTETGAAVETKTGFGERYREPTEQRTDVDTDVMIGITATPAERFDVRLLMMSSWHGSSGATELETRRWWISFSFRP